IELKIKEKIFDKRIRAHEDILELAAMMRTTVSTNEKRADNVLITYPVIFSSKESFISFQTFFYQKVNPNTHWLSNDLSRELSAIQDYIATIKIAVEDINSKNLPLVGMYVRNDFVDFAATLENASMDFFKMDIIKLSLVPKKRFKNFSNEERQKRFQKSAYFQNYDEIIKVINQNKA